MPGWHEATRELQDRGKIRLAGIIQEQHPDRCRLFMQWKQMRWPILVDSLNLLGVRGVPISLLIDEHGVVRGRVRNPRVSAEAIRAFIETRYERPADLPAPASAPDPEKLAAKTNAGSSPEAWMALGDALFLRGGKGDLTASAGAYRRAVELGAPPEAQFRLGVALRRRYETEERRGSDLQGAFTAWGNALSSRPNQYIWRRRIEQYGPRLEKPYAFYDWVSRARKDIASRGETPAELAVEPRGAELAHPLKSFLGDRSGEAPDPRGRIQRDKKSIIRAEIGVAPAIVRPGGAARVHIALRPDGKLKGHWNNEAGKLRVWVDAPEGIEVDKRQLTAPNAERAVSTEPREVEFELRVAENVETGVLTIPAYALYFVCEDVDGVCMYLRKDIEVNIQVRPRR